jgi:cephalosporin hydroxylase
MSMSPLEEALQAAYQSFDAGDFGRVQQICREIIDQAPEKSEAWYLGGVAVFQTGRLDLAFGYFNRAIELSPDVESYRLDLATAYRSLGLLDEAARCYRDIIARNPSSPACQCLATISAYQRFNQPRAVRPPTFDTAAVDAWLEQAFQIGMWQVRDEIAGLCAFLQQQDLGHVMEIGSLMGGSFFLWCRLARGKKISLDLPCPGFAGSVEDARQVRTAAMRRWAPQVFALSGDSHDGETRERVAEVLAGEQLDFLFIDGDHTYEGVKLDYQMYQPFVRPGGWIAFHDIVDTDFHRGENCQVSRFWRELVGEKREFNAHQQWGGIGLIRAPLA